MGKNNSFQYVSAPYRFVAEYFDGKWNEGQLSDNANIVINESACVFQYAQTCFEGLKAYRTADGKTVCFRPELNAQRFADSCKRMMMPIVSTEMFLRGIDETIRANKELVPDNKDGGTLYIRPFMIGTTPLLSVKPADEFQFRIYASPVGGYFGSNTKPLSLVVSDFDRAAPKGTGHVKAGLNYAMSFYPLSVAKSKGYDENIFSDSASRTFVEETGGANVFFVTDSGKIVVPKSDTILPSITRRSMVEIARNYLDFEVEERAVRLDEIGNFKECGLCGTAAVIAPVGSIDNNGKTVEFDTSCNGFGKTCAVLREVLTGMQFGKLPAPEGWLHVVCEGGSD